MKTIIWDGHERMIPDVGLASLDKELTLADDLADSFVKQGLAHFKQSEVTKPKTEGGKQK